MKSLDIKFLIPNDMEMEDLVEAMALGFEEHNIFNRKTGQELFEAEVSEVLIRDRLVIVKEKK